jgi:hypothetical protein
MPRHCSAGSCDGERVAAHQYCYGDCHYSRPGCHAENCGVAGAFSAALQKALFKRIDDCDHLFGMCRISITLEQRFDFLAEQG